MPLADWILTTARLGAFVAAGAFVARYAFVRWERTPAGRSIMALSCAIIVVLVAALLKSLETFTSLAFGDGLLYFTAFAWTVVAGVFVWRNRELTRSQRARGDR